MPVIKLIFNNRVNDKTDIEWPVVPQKKEVILYDGNKYVVNRIVHDTDFSTINVHLIKAI